MSYENLADEKASGVEIVNNFVTIEQIEAVLNELADEQKVDWYDAHEVYQNQRGLTITQNHFTFALKLSRGDQSILKQLPAIDQLKTKTEDFINNLAETFPSLANWQADEVSFHLYDDQEVGLSKHRDNLRFVGLVAIVALEGQADLVISRPDDDLILPTEPGDLCLLRAPGLIESELEIRPEHSLLNLKTETRTSMMVRANNRPGEPLAGFKFNNWSNK